MGKLLSIDTEKREIANVEDFQAEPTRAIYYGVFFRGRDGTPQSATKDLHAECGNAEGLMARRKAEDMQTEYFVAPVSVPISEKEAGKCAERI